jgi:O-acetyl-ADP-ribose deacetylase (regulator of RNase III)
MLHRGTIAMANVDETSHNADDLSQTEPQVSARQSEGAEKATAAAATAPQVVLSSSTVRYAIKERPDLIVGYKTGAIDDVRRVSIWVNPENTDMLMDRVIGRSISARIRYLGSNRDDDGNIVEDTIAEALRRTVGPRGHVRIGTVLVTESGTLKIKNHVQRIFHVAIVEATPGSAMKGSQDKLAQCVRTLLERAERENKRLWRITFRLTPFKSILVPMMGAGEGGLVLEDVAETIIPAAIEHLRNVELPTLKEVYFLAFTSRQKSACDRVLERYCADGTLVGQSDT